MYMYYIIIISILTNDDFIYVVYILLCYTIILLQYLIYDITYLLFTFFGLWTASA